MEPQRTPAEEQRIYFEAIGQLITDVAKYEERAPKLKDDFRHLPFDEMLDANLKVMRVNVELIKPLQDSKKALDEAQMQIIRDAAHGIRNCVAMIDQAITAMTRLRNSRVINIGGMGKGR